MILLVGLPGSGKTTVARKLEREHHALRLSLDEWMIPLFGQPETDGKRDAFATTSVDLDRWRAMFDVPDEAELAGSPPAGTTVRLVELA
jgi:predicted kinase